MAESMTLIPTRIQPAQPEYVNLSSWPFAASPFYVPQVLDLLQNDLPLRVVFSKFCVIWLYRDSSGNAVGFGSLDVCNEYLQFTSNREYSYIPVLAVHPAHSGKGYGKQIVEHLFAEAVLVHESLSDNHDHSDLLLLDVYQANTPAINLYRKCGFETFETDHPMLDPKQSNEPYVIMSRKIG